MIYNGEAFYIDRLKPSDALHLNKLLVSNTQRLKRFLPKTIAANRTLEGSKRYIKSKMDCMKAKSEFVFTIKDKPTKNVAGLIILKNLNWKAKQGEFAYCIGEKFKGQGWMKQAISATSTFATDDLGLKTLQIIAHHSNKSSVNVAINSGFRWKETLDGEFTPEHESPLDMELYELTI
ncbi:ribosomal-protein-alanine N-acetyltransferase [Flavobacteriaceae bacterium MAR_2010_72]|nr:ribosomal-protein-alanine N-acetyltransferase [Flavobacteriaceae bacterium MAR_2010_72]TVZ58201.1 ribosomal-protein-alanine N-acetyltransferase [Flavobacteriaceae bacterium MAR_2010_105]